MDGAIALVDGCEFKIKAIREVTCLVKPVKTGSQVFMGNDVMFHISERCDSGLYDVDIDARSIIRPRPDKLRPDALEVKNLIANSPIVSDFPAIEAEILPGSWLRIGPDRGIYSQPKELAVVLYNNPTMLSSAVKNRSQKDRSQWTSRQDLIAAYVQSGRDLSMPDFDLWCIELEVWSIRNSVAMRKVVPHDQKPINYFPFKGCFKFDLSLYEPKCNDLNWSCSGGRGFSSMGFCYDPHDLVLIYGRAPNDSFNPDHVRKLLEDCLGVEPVVTQKSVYFLTTLASPAVQLQLLRWVKLRAFQWVGIRVRFKTRNKGITLT